MLSLNDGRAELWQWDTGRTLSVDADCSQVHFSNKVFGRSIDVDVVDGSAIIPDILLQTDKDLNVWAFVGTAENGYTKISKTFKVNRRNKPADYVFTPADQITLQTIQSQIGDLSDLTTEAKDTLVAAINEALALGGGKVGPEEVWRIVGEYLASNPPTITESDPTVPAWAKHPTKPSYTAEEVGALPDSTVIPTVPDNVSAFRNDAGYLTEHQDISGKLDASELPTAINTALAQAKASGEFDGADGHTPEYGVDYGTPEQIQGIAQSAADILQPDLNQLKDDLDNVDTRLSESIAEISDVAKRLEMSYLKTTWEYGDLIGNGVEADSTYLKRTGYLDEKIITFEAKGTKVYVYYFDKNKVFKMYKSYAEDHIISIAEYDDIKYIRLVIREDALNTAVFKASYPMNDGTLGYITPEIFGAIGDRLTDDTEAVQKCFEFARVTSQLGDFPKRIKLAQSYKITKTILITGLRYCDVSVDGNILYTGVESAFLISGCRFTDFSFGMISASSGDCIQFASNSNTDDYVSYCKLKFKRLYAKNACIRMSIGATGGYINENTIVGGMLSNGAYGIYVDAKGRSEVQFKSYNLGFEGVNVGACLDGASYCSFINPRYGEMKDKTLIQTLSETRNIQFVGVDLLIPSMLELSANTSMSINAPIIHAHNGPILSYIGKVEDGVLKYAVQNFEYA